MARQHCGRISSLYSCQGVDFPKEVYLFLLKYIYMKQAGTILLSNFAADLHIQSIFHISRLSGKKSIHQEWWLISLSK